MTDLEKIYAGKEVYTDGENVILHKKDVAFWLTYGALQCYLEYEDNETLESFLGDNSRIMADIAKLDNEALVGLSYHPMSNWYYVNMGLVDEWERGEI